MFYNATKLNVRKLIIHCNSVTGVTDKQCNKNYTGHDIKLKKNQYVYYLLM